MEEYILQIKFKNKAITPREYIAKSKQILIELENFDPIFKDFFGWGKTAKAKKEFKSDKSDFENIVFEQIKNDKIVYYNDDPNDKKMYLDSKSWLPYSNSYSNTTKVNDGQITIAITYGDTKKDIGVFLIKFPKCNYKEFSDYNFIKELMIKCTSFFDSIYTVVISHDFIDKVLDKNKKFWIGWMTYIKNQNILNELSSSNFLYQKEHMYEGTFFSLSEDRPNASDDVLINKVIEMRNKLGSQGYLNYSKELSNS
ncbi:hypothetical protein [Aquimarina aquimarini]|uniref:hypothetical protein n=1 Tax=Aquimarina aquimarini TaxID=1191734 RepID=UPI000D552A0B|nr:hypothetical protein [Aquimarina aquimarini]